MTAPADYPIAFGEPIPVPPEERSRRLLAFWLMAILTLVVFFIGFYIVAKGAASAGELVSVLLTPIIGLVGSVIGFYFGGNKDA